MALKAPKVKHKRGRPKKGEARPPTPTAPSRIQQQLSQSLAYIKAELPTRCDSGAKRNAQGYKNSWNGYQHSISTPPTAASRSPALLTSASVHDLQSAIPLSMMSAARVTNLYEVMDAAYFSATLRAYR